MANEVMCPYCGAMISEKATVCRHCGRLLTGSVKYDADGAGVWYGDAPDGHTGEEAQRLRRRSRGILWAVIALGTLLMIGFIALFAYFIADFAQTAVEHSNDVDSIISVITDTAPTEIAGSEDIDTLPGVVDEMLSDQMTLITDYMTAFEKNDHPAAAKLFHPAILQAYENDADTMLADLDEHFSEYGTELSGWNTIDSEAVDAEGIAELNEALPIGIETAEVHLIELTPVSGGAIDVYLLLVQTAEGWSLYYSY